MISWAHEIDFNQYKNNFLEVSFIKNTCFTLRNKEVPNPLTSRIWLFLTRFNSDSRCDFKHSVWLIIKLIKHFNQDKALTHYRTLEKTGDYINEDM